MGDHITKPGLPAGAARRTGPRPVTRSRSSSGIRELPPFEALLPLPLADLSLPESPGGSDVHDRETRPGPTRLSRARIAIVIGLVAIVVSEIGFLVIRALQ